jgi:hypothetical protein
VLGKIYLFLLWRDYGVLNKMAGGTQGAKGGETLANIYCSKQNGIANHMRSNEM